MLFSHKRKLNDSEYRLVKGVLSELMGKSKANCNRLLENEGYTLLDDWQSKLGFVKELNSETFLLTVHFQDDNSCNYRLIIKNEAEEWIDQKIIDFKYLKDLKII